jgi:hypothetical protein
MNGVLQRRDSGRAIIDLREAASILGLAVLVPLAIQGLLLVAVWAAVTLFAGESFPDGSHLSAVVAGIILLSIRTVILAVWWIWLSVTNGRTWWVGVLAALPIFGIIAALWLSVKIVRNRNQRVTFPDFGAVVLALIVIVSLVSLPFALRTATVLADRESTRLASPCLTGIGESTGDSPVVTIDGRQIDRAELDSWVAEVSSRQTGAVARRDPRWPGRILESVVQLRLTAQLARQLGVTASTGEAEGRLAPAVDQFPESLAFRQACASALQEKLLPKVKLESNETGAQALARVLGELGARSVTGLAPEFGFWSPDRVGFVQTQPATPVIAIDAPRAYATKVSYEIASIPGQEFDGTLNWSANVCLGVKDLLQPRYLGQVGLYERVAGAWVKVPGAKATAKAGGRCSGGQVNVIIGATATEPTSNWTNKGWTTCRSHQVRIPETPTFRPTIIDLCVATEATSESEGS